MRLSEWRSAAPIETCMSQDVLDVLLPVLSDLGAGTDPDCWVAWGDDPQFRYPIFASTPAGLISVNVRLASEDGPRVTGKLVRWPKVQVTELSIESSGGHRIVAVQVEGQVLKGTDAEADQICAFMREVINAIDGRTVQAIVAGTVPGLAPAAVAPAAVAPAAVAPAAKAPAAKAPAAPGQALPTPEAPAEASTQPPAHSPVQSTAEQAPVVRGVEKILAREAALGATARGGKAAGAAGYKSNKGATEGKFAAGPQVVAPEASSPEKKADDLGGEASSAAASPADVTGAQAVELDRSGWVGPHPIGEVAEESATSPVVPSGPEPSGPEPSGPESLEPLVQRKRRWAP